MKTVTLFTRERCHLCDDALAVLERVRTSLPFRLEIVDLDVEAPADKRAAYDWDVPVIELDGRKVMKHRVDEARLVRLLDPVEGAPS
jgi:glutaredoxin